MGSKIKDVIPGEVAYKRTTIDPSNILEFYNVSFAFNDKRASQYVVQNFSMSMQKGSICSITSLRAFNFNLFVDMMLRLYPFPQFLITEGEVWFKGVNTTAFPRSQIAEGLTARFNVVGSAARFGLTAGRSRSIETVYDSLLVGRETDPRYLKQNLAAMGFDKSKLFGMPVSSLTPDDAQRIKLCEGMSIPNDVLVLVEPTMNLSPTSKYNLQNLLYSKCSSGFYKLIIILTEDIEFAGETSDKICILDGSRIAELGSREEIIRLTDSDFVRSMLYHI